MSQIPSKPSAQPDYADLELRIRERRDEGYPVEITLNGEQDLGHGYLSEVESWAPSADKLVDGQGLFSALFADPDLRDAWIKACGQAPKRRVRLRIDTAAAELHALPWEQLHDGQALLSAHGDTPFSRYLPVALPWSGPVIERPIRVLVAISNPDDLSEFGLAPLDLDLERSMLETVFRELDPHELEATFLDPPVTLERLEEAMRGAHVLQYLGHGAFDQGQRQAALFLQDEEGKTELVRDDELIGMLARRHVRPQLVFLAACESATRATADAFAGLGPKLVGVGVPAVVAMQDFVSLETARKLCGAFYRRLAEHGIVDCALNEARGALLTGGRPDAAVPVLFMRLRSGQLWEGEADARGEVLGAVKPEAFWTTLVRQIEKGRCTPIVGPRAHGAVLPTLSDIAQRWAEMHGYPFASRQDMARVAQYLATSAGEDFPRTELLDALEKELLAHLPEASQPSGGYRTLTGLVEAVGWDQLVGGNPNEIHHVLADLNLPLYLTSNPDGFLVEALKARGRQPIREVCHWSEHLDWLDSHLGEEEDYEPTPDRPLVYHLFGSDEQVDSLVLTEDQFFSFLVRTLAEDRIPTVIRDAFSTTSLMFLGYSLFDWEFRVLLHGLVNSFSRRRSFKHVAVQLELADLATANTPAVQTFLQQYFQDANINVYWGSTAQFAAELREHWDGREQ